MKTNDVNDPLALARAVGVLVEDDTTTTPSRARVCLEVLLVGTYGSLLAVLCLCVI